MKAQQVSGIAVVSIGAGERVGSVSELLLDLDGKRVAAFVLGSGGGVTGSLLSSTEPSTPRTLGADQVHAIGPDAITVQDASVIQETAAGEGLTPLSELTKRKVVTEGGTFVGQIASIELDERSMRLTHLEVSPGFFKSNQLVEADQIITVGPEMVIVDNAVCADQNSADDLTSEGDAEGRFIVVNDQRSDRAEV